MVYTVRFVCAILLNMLLSLLILMCHLGSNLLCGSFEYSKVKAFWVLLSCVVIGYDFLCLVLWSLVATCPKLWRDQIGCMAVQRAIQAFSYSMIIVFGVPDTTMRKIDLVSFIGMTIYCYYQYLFIARFQARIDSCLAKQPKVKMSIAHTKSRILDIKKKLEAENLKRVKPEAKIVIDPCSICLEEIPESDDVYDLTCSHYFHMGCLDLSVKALRFTCPLCRGPIRESEIEPTQLIESAETEFLLVDDMAFHTPPRRAPGIVAQIAAMEAENRRLALETQNQRWEAEHRVRQAERDRRGERELRAQQEAQRERAYRDQYQIPAGVSSWRHTMAQQAGHYRQDVVVSAPTPARRLFDNVQQFSESLGNGVDNAMRDFVDAITTVGDAVLRR